MDADVGDADIGIISDDGIASELSGINIGIISVLVGGDIGIISVGEAKPEVDCWSWAAMKSTRI